MQDGVGRSGYRMLALVFLGIGALGIASSLYAFLRPTFPFFNALGFVLSGVALVSLFVLCLVILRRGEAGSQASQPAVATPTFTPSPSRPLQFEPETDQEDLEPEAEVAPEEVDSPPAVVRSPGGPRMPAPTFERAARVVGLPDESRPFDRLPPPEQWTPPEQPRAPPIAPPLRRAPSGLTMGQKREMERQGIPVPRPARGPAATGARPAREVFEADEMEVAIPLALHPARTPAPKPGIPTVLAKAAKGEQDPDWVPEGQTRGLCSKCKTVLLAPKQRPVNVRCPRCDKITLLAQ